jgi:hypothetical protein
MTAREKLVAKILAGTADQTIPFDGLITLLEYFGFARRISGSHHIFSRADVEEILNLQPRRDGTAKPYQVRQVRNVLIRYKLAGHDHGT